jgi:hypothetical protein
MRTLAEVRKPVGRIATSGIPFLTPGWRAAREVGLVGATNGRYGTYWRHCGQVGNATAGPAPVSKRTRKVPQLLYGFSQALAFQILQEFVGRFRGILEAGSMLRQRRDHGPSVLVNQGRNHLVRSQDSDSVFR